MLHKTTNGNGRRVNEFERERDMSDERALERGGDGCDGKHARAAADDDDDERGGKHTAGMLSVRARAFALKSATNRHGQNRLAKGRRAIGRAVASDDEEDKRVAARAPLGREFRVASNDRARKRALETRLKVMEALPKTSKYAKGQIEIIVKALEILKRVEADERGRTKEEEEELAFLLRAVKI